MKWTRSRRRVAIAGAECTDPGGSPGESTIILAFPDGERTRHVEDGGPAHDAPAPGGFPAYEYAGPLSPPSATDSVVRADLLALAAATFGSERSAREWLDARALALDGSDRRSYSTIPPASTKCALCWAGFSSASTHDLSCPKRYSTLRTPPDWVEARSEGPHVPAAYPF